MSIKVKIDNITINSPEMRGFSTIFEIVLNRKISGKWAIGTGRTAMACKR